MEILKSTVTDPGFPPEEYTYGKVDENTLYYFIKDYKLENGNIIATTNMQEALGHAAYTSLGVINNDGKVLIPFENKMIKPIKDQLLLVEKNLPTTVSVLEALKNKSDPLALQTLVQNAATIKKQLQGIMGISGDFVFDNQFSEAALYTMDGGNIANQYFSFIGENNGDYYLATNVLGATIMKFNPNQLYQEQTRDMEPQQDVPPQVSNATVQQEEQKQAEAVSSPNSTLAPSIDIPVQNMAPDEQPPIVQTENQEEKQQPFTFSDDQDQKVDGNHSEVELNIQGEQAQTAIDEPAFNTNSTPLEYDEESSQNDENFEEEEESYQEEDVNDDENYDDDDFDVSEEDIELKEDEISDEEESDYDEEEDLEEEEIEKESKKKEEKDPYNITPEDITNPVILDATNTITKLLEETRNQRKQIDKLLGEAEVNQSNQEILQAERDSLKLENQSLRHERDDYRSQLIDSQRENTKLRSAFSRQSELLQSVESQNSSLKQQVAGMHALSNAINEANVLVQPVEDPSFNNNSSYHESSLDIDHYLNGDYKNNNRMITPDISYFTGKHGSTSDTNENSTSYRRSKAA